MPHREEEPLALEERGVAVEVDVGDVGEIEAARLGPFHEGVLPAEVLPGAAPLEVRPVERDLLRGTAGVEALAAPRVVGLPGGDGRLEHRRALALVGAHDEDDVGLRAIVARDRGDVDAARPARLRLDGEGDGPAALDESRRRRRRRGLRPHAHGAARGDEPSAGAAVPPHAVEAPAHGSRRVGAEVDVNRLAVVHARCARVALEPPRRGALAQLPPAVAGQRVLRRNRVRARRDRLRPRGGPERNEQEDRDDARSGPPIPSHPSAPVQPGAPAPASRLSLRIAARAGTSPDVDGSEKDPRRVGRLGRAGPPGSPSRCVAHLAAVRRSRRTPRGSGPITHRQVPVNSRRTVGGASPPSDGNTRRASDGAADCNCRAVNARILDSFGDLRFFARSLTRTLRGREETHGHRLQSSAEPAG